MADNKSYAWPMIIIGLAIAAAGVWKLAPVVYAHIPNEAKASLRASFDRRFGQRPVAGRPAANDDDEANGDEAGGDEASGDADMRQYSELEAEAAAIMERYNIETAKRSPYGREAAAALKQLRELRRTIHTRKYESLDDRQAAMHKLASLQLKVSELNLRHKEWKAEHAAELPDPSKDEKLKAIRQRQKALFDIKP